MSQLVSLNLAFDFHFLGAFFECVAVVVEFFTAADADFEFY